MRPLIRVLLFAGARDAVGRELVEIELEGDALTARALLDRLISLHPQLAPWAGSLRVAVNNAYARWEEEIVAGDEVAIIPPVAGG